MKTIWIDITNTPQVNFLVPVIKYLETHYNLFITARDFSETVTFLKSKGVNPLVLGDHKGKSRFMKMLGFGHRMLELYKTIPHFDVSISMGGNQPALLSRLRNKKSIIFSDNDLSFKGFSYKFGTHFIFPQSFKYSLVMEKYGISKDQIHVLQGFKEDIYIASFQPNNSLLNDFPFKEFITVRPENLKASYVPTNAETIVPALFQKLKNYNILFLPRYKEEESYAKGFDNIYIPKSPLNGLDVCYYTSVMLTGAGSFAREAALLGTPAVSFFPNPKLLSVDKQLVEEGKMIHSRNLEDITKYVELNIASKEFNSGRIQEAKSIQADMFEFIEYVIKTA